MILYCPGIQNWFVGKEETFPLGESYISTEDNVSEKYLLPPLTVTIKY